ncbi:unnamed protein product, partial [Staurois parvus]
MLIYQNGTYSNKTQSTYEKCKFDLREGRTDNSWGPQAIGDHGAPVSLPKLKKKPMKKVPGESHRAPTDPRPSGSARVSKME